ncbi:proclotting enzyme-like [Toxorhynchites rutilus septentrionalis]|uniref:proclotting enzyme-like n=1 Tax=Toxorhynchites rutilus septentrionalis TaxID=329112 RepID=UPI0024787669|nr:proclotting enzyme-like [Toxorhynchites rutilus septentrionalis]
MMIERRVLVFIVIGSLIVSAVAGLIAKDLEQNDDDIDTIDRNLVEGEDNKTRDLPAKLPRRRQPFRELKAEREKKHRDFNHVRRKRFIGQMFNPPNKAYQECVTPNGEKGHCKRYQHCRLQDSKDIWKMLGQLCVIENISIGVCCPDNRTEGIGPEFSVRLPAQGDDGYDPVEGLDGDGSNDEGRDAKTEERGCGISTKQVPKIAGGRPADPGEWPWMAALITNQAQQSFCGGVLVTDRHVLTAAHCMLNLKINQFLVRLGEYDFTQYNETRSRDFRVTEIRSHSDFDPVTYENDIALLKLFRPSFFNSYIWPICMPPLDDNWNGYKAVVVGWGTQFFGGPHSMILMEVTVPVWSNAECQEVYINRIYDTSLCAGDYQGGKDSCQGDSGGPLMVQLPNKRWVTVGIVSWGIRCGEANHPGIYTRVSLYVRWIIENAVF